MRLPRTLSAGVVAIAVAFLTTTPASAALVGDVRGPACADVADGAGVYTGTAVNLRLNLSAAACRRITYTLHVLSADGSTLLTTALPTSTTRPTATDPIPHVFYAAPVSGPTEVCVYVTTTIVRQDDRATAGADDDDVVVHVFDRAPDTNCVLMQVDGGISAQSMR